MLEKRTWYKNSFVWGVIVTVLAIVLSFFYFYIHNDILLDKSANISDIYANLINITILLLTVFVLSKITEQGNKLDRSISIEKGILLDRLSAISSKSESLYEIVETGQSNYQFLKRYFDGLNRNCDLIGDLIQDENSLLKGDKSDILNRHASLQDHLNKCRSILLDTPVRAATSVERQTYISVDQDEVTIHEQGIAAARIQINHLITDSVNLYLFINRL